MIQKQGSETQSALEPISSLIGGDEGDRTPDLLHAMQALSQLSYAPMHFIILRLADFVNGILKVFLK